MTNYLDHGALADKAFAEYEFGNSVTVTDTSGWEYTTPGNERTRKVYVETEREDDGPAPRWVLNFTVRFDPASGAVSEAYAMDAKGQIWGNVARQRKVHGNVGSATDLHDVGEWVGLHYGRNFDAEPEAKRQEWIERFAEAHELPVPQGNEERAVAVNKLAEAVQTHQAAQVERDTVLLGRNQAAMAERAFEAYNFGEGVAVAGVSGWEYYATGHERSREVYVENVINDGKGKPSTRLGFTVRFDPQTGLLAEAYAEDATGSAFGCMPEGQLQKLNGRQAAETVLGERAGELLGGDGKLTNLTDPANMNPAWSNEHCEAAQREGWGIFDTHGSDGGRWQIQRFDDASEVPGVPQLNDDETAWRFVIQGTAAHHEAARRFIRTHSPKEWAALNQREASNYIEHPASAKTGTFAAKYDQRAERNGQTFTVLGAVDPSTYDAAECGDMFSIRFADGVQIEAWPEEVESAVDVSIYTDPNEFLVSEYSKYAEHIAEGDPMAFDDWLGGSDLPEIVKAREIAKVQERNLSKYTRQQLARISELDAAIDSAADQGDDVFFAAVAAKDEYIDSQGIDRNRLEVTGREVSNCIEPSASWASSHSAYEVTEEDVENVLCSNSLAVAHTNGKSFESSANELHGELDFNLIEQAALAGDDLDEQTDYANDEIARQLREMGVLEPVKPACDSPSPGM